MSFCKIELGSHYVKITDMSTEFRGLVENFCRKFMTYKLVKVGRRFVKKPAKVFAAATQDRTEYRIHRHQFEHFKTEASLGGFNIVDSMVTYAGDYIPAKANIVMDPEWVARDYQVPIIQYLVEPGYCKTVTLQTGRGKTGSSLKAIETIGERFIVAVLGRYFDKWIGDIKKQYVIEDGDMITARGSKEFKSLLKFSSHKDYNPQVIVTTIDTLHGYIREYNLTKFKGQPEHIVPPEQLWGKLGCGVRLIDEVHQHFHTVYILDLYTHIYKGIGLSATLGADDKITDSMYGIAFPMKTRINGGVYIKVSDATCIHYRFKDPKKIRYQGFAKGYSHVVFEESLVKQRQALQNYLDMILTVVKQEYVKVAKTGQKMLIFAAKIETCEIIRDYLEEMLPDYVVEKYTSEDDYETFERADIVTSTIGSSGTAIDIPDLITVLMTTVINSKNANEQALGRLRDLRIPGFNPKFLYFSCDDIGKHREYTNRKHELFADKVFTHKSEYYEKRI